MTDIGIIYKTHKGISFEWTINDFCSYTEVNTVYFSSEFYILNSTWTLKLCPNGRTIDNSTGHVSLFLRRVDDGASKSVNFTIGVKTEKQEIVHKRKIKSWKSNAEGYGWSKFLERKYLQQERRQLVPFGNLTICCTVLVNLDEIDFNVDDTKDKLIDDYKDMIVSKKNTDVTIKVDEETFSAHRCVLAVRSPVLAAMFENDMIEKETGFVDIPDCDPEAFKHFLLFLYSGELDFHKCDAFHLYKIADKYAVAELQSMCVKFMINNISLDNFCETYVFGHQFNENKLLTTIQNFFSENFAKILSLDSWMSLMKEETCLANNLLKEIAYKVTIEKNA